MYCYCDIMKFSLELYMRLHLIPVEYHYPGISRKPLGILNRHNKPELLFIKKYSSILYHKATVIK